jgi:hypothetical protein
LEGCFREDRLYTFRDLADERYFPRVCVLNPLPAMPKLPYEFKKQEIRGEKLLTFSENNSGKFSVPVYADYLAYAPSKTAVSSMSRMAPGQRMRPRNRKVSELNQVQTSP